MATTPTPPAAADQTKELVKQTGSRSIKDLLVSDEFRAQVAMALPKHMKVERFIRVALNATLRQPELLQCQRESLFLALLQLSAYGIEADGRRAHLIPYWDKKTCTCMHLLEEHRQGQCSKCDCKTARKRRLVNLILDYKGIAELVRRSGDVSYIHADVVLEGDDWDFQFGSAAFLRHKPSMTAGAADKRRCVAFYSFVKLKDGSEDFIVLSKSDVDAVRARSQSSSSGPWVTDYNEMGKKTAFKRHSKWLPLSPETRDAVEDDEGEDFSVGAGLVLDGMSTVVQDEPPDDEPEDKETLADRVKKGAAAQGAVKEEPKKEAETKPTPEPTKQSEQPQEARRGPLKVFAKDELPDAMDMKLGYRCISDGETLEVVDAGNDLQRWATVARVAEEQPLQSGLRGRKRNPGAFDQGGEA